MAITRTYSSKTNQTSEAPAEKKDSGRNYPGTT